MPPAGRALDCQEETPGNKKPRYNRGHRGFICKKRRNELSLSFLHVGNELIALLLDIEVILAVGRRGNLDFFKL